MHHQIIRFRAYMADNMKFRRRRYNQREQIIDSELTPVTSVLYARGRVKYLKGYE
jgi:hypothetical protein